MGHHIHPIQVQNAAFLLTTIPAWLVIGLIVGAVREQTRRGIAQLAPQPATIAPRRSAVATRARALGSTSLL